MPKKKASIRELIPKESRAALKRGKNKIEFCSGTASEITGYLITDLNGETRLKQIVAGLKI